MIDALRFHFQLYILAPGRHLAEGSKGQRRQVVLASPFTSCCPESPQSCRMSSDPEPRRSWMERRRRRTDEAVINAAGRRVWLPSFVLLPPGSPASPPLFWTRGGACLYRWSYPSSLTSAQTSQEPPGVRLIDINHQHSKVGLQRLLEGAQSLSYGA